MHCNACVYVIEKCVWTYYLLKSKQSSTCRWHRTIESLVPMWCVNMLIKVMTLVISDASGHSGCLRNAIKCIEVTKFMVKKKNVALCWFFRQQHNIYSFRFVFRPSYKTVSLQLHHSPLFTFTVFVESFVTSMKIEFDDRGSDRCSKIHKRTIFNMT